MGLLLLGRLTEGAGGAVVYAELGKTTTIMISCLVTAFVALSSGFAVYAAIFHLKRVVSELGSAAWPGFAEINEAPTAVIRLEDGLEAAKNTVSALGAEIMVIL